VTCRNVNKIKTARLIRAPKGLRAQRSAGQGYRNETALQTVCAAAVVTQRGEDDGQRGLMYAATLSREITGR
jgi:hypothetical protein